MTDGESAVDQATVSALNDQIDVLKDALKAAHGFLHAGEPDGWNYKVPVEELCGGCDGHDHPRIECEECFGTGRTRRRNLND